MAKKIVNFVVGASVVVADKYKGTKETRELLCERIGCLDKDLDSGNLKVKMIDQDGNLEIDRPGLAGTKNGIRPKFFQPYTSRKEEAVDTISTVETAEAVAV